MSFFLTNYRGQYLYIYIYMNPSVDHYLLSLSLTVREAHIEISCFELLVPPTAAPRVWCRSG